MQVKDYQGKIIDKEKVRRIKGEDGTYRYYEMGVACILMPDDLWYRVNTGKIIYDNSIKAWIFSKDFKGLIGLLEDGTTGSFSDTTNAVTINVKKEKETKKIVIDPISGSGEVKDTRATLWQKSICINEKAALKNGFIESISDGAFYKKEHCSPEDFKKFSTIVTPQSERTNVYSLDDDKEYRTFLEESYDSNNIKIPRELELLAKRYIPYTFGVEIETQVGWLPARIREPLGFRVCRDGSLDGGLEFVSIPMEGGKGLAVLDKVCGELTKRASISNKCSVHIHFGDVRRDRLYFISLWQLLTKIQEEFRCYFPFSRTNSIREDGKIYAALLPDLELDVNKLLLIKGEDTFKKRVTEEFSKIYTWLNNGHPPGEVFDSQFIKETRESLIKGKIQKQYCYRVKKFNYTTKLPRHAIQGHKWQRPQRYLWTNFLNLFFAHSNTVEMRVCEATTNFDKILKYMLICVAILKYAENFKNVFSANGVTMENVIRDHYPEEISKQLINYLLERKNLFCNTNGGFKSQWKNVEAELFENDKTYRNELKL